jgi:hypothetical protein
MAIKVDNKSKLHLDQLVDMYKHYLILVDKSKIINIQFFDEFVEIYSSTSLLGKFYYGKSYIGNGYVLWFDEQLGEGVIKAKNGDCLPFYSSHVDGANNSMPHLVTNVQLKTGERVKFKLHNDHAVVANIGAVEIRKVAS